MFIRYLLILSVVLLTVFSCRNQEEIVSTSFSNNPIKFDSDTILFDTLITTGKVSITKRLKVFNTSSNAVIINSISLGKGNNSNFSVFCNGLKSVNFSNVKLLGKDSLYILVNIVPLENNSSNVLILEDSLVFSIQNLVSSVKLLAWGQDAYYFNNDTISSDFTFKSDKPNVIYGSILVDSLSTLTANSNTRLYFYNNAKIISKGQIVFNGSKEQPILLQSFREDGKYENQPGLWGGIFINGKGVSKFNWVIIKNSGLGIEVNNDNHNLKISHSKFFNFSSYAINLINCNSLEIDNSLFYKSLYELLHADNVSNLNVYNNTFANVQSGYSRSLPSVKISEKLAIVNFINNIVWGDLQYEFSNLAKSPTIIDVNFNIFKAKEIDIKNTNNYYLKNSSEFIFKDISKYDFRPDSIFSLSSNKKIPSKARNNGSPNLFNNDYLDLYGNLRDSNPDIGAIEY